MLTPEDLEFKLFEYAEQALDQIWEPFLSSLSLEHQVRMIFNMMLLRIASHDTPNAIRDAAVELLNSNDFSDLKDSQELWKPKQISILPAELKRIV